MLLHRITIFSALSLLISPGSAHPGHHHHHHHEEEHSQNLRNLSLFSGGPANGHCKDGEPSFTVGGVTYECKADFNEKGGNCRTLDPTPEEIAKAKADFDWWKEQKKNKGNGNTRGAGSGRRLGGCTGADCAGFDSGKVITVPTHFHIFHNGNDGIKYTCEGNYETGFVAGAGGAGNCKYVQDQIKATNKGFRGISVDGNGQYHSDTKIQFCLASSNDLYSSSAYNNAGAYADSGSAYKGTHRVGQMESFNVWVNQASGYLGYATFPSSSYKTDDGVVLLNDSMPGGTATSYNLGDTLTHEIGHWIGLYHTFQGGCSSSTGDYQHYVGSQKTTERASTFGCPTSNPDTCTENGTTRGQYPDPIHNFMDYTDDDCMDEFTPGQTERMQSAWELYRHCDGCGQLQSADWSVAADGFTCVYGEPGTQSPTSSASPTAQPTTKPTNAPTQFSCAAFTTKEACPGGCRWVKGRSGGCKAV